MNYPVWEMLSTGGGLLIAIVSAIHVYIAHFAVGGGLFLVWTERKSYAENNPTMTEYIKKHTRFFLLLTMVLGAMTGVGIWLTISAVHPGVTSLMIHNFVFAWASEWVFFTVEIATLLIYYYTFGKMSRQNHLKIGWIYFAAAWLSLVIINAIISFMLTPGDWVKTKNFWDGLINPSFLPSTLFRTALAVMLAGLYGYLTSINLKDESLRRTMVRYCSRWVVLPLIVLIPTGWWYLEVIPPAAREMISGGVLDPAYFANWVLYLTPIIIIGALVMAARLPLSMQSALAVGLFILGFLGMGAFEYVRETSRRPYVVYDHMYSNGLLKDQVAQSREQGVLTAARWVKTTQINDQNQEQAGRELFRLLCVSCHSMGGPRNDILVQTKSMDQADLLKIMQTMGGKRAYMPPFPGNELEKTTLADYLVKKTP
ncbi:c-type cytochrome [Dethiosulfatarculus sandiegensis]|uniref:Cytochrome C n=1 Tax=Dethiosulfatarculus sandiegensis TaxID=1429043 RepID=A0A0D2HSZ0_9BACT|nr:cytochrome ubiquinol oxidase subunit I [Dethiosulfatarculus sandiegensis]KIX13663.1 cytochrome C [Dethiosulfatarculus sandiegensis]